MPENQNGKQGFVSEKRLLGQVEPLKMTARDSGFMIHITVCVMQQEEQKVGVGY